MESFPHAFSTIQEDPSHCLHLVWKDRPSFPHLLPLLEMGGKLMCQLQIQHLRFLKSWLMFSLPSLVVFVLLPQHSLNHGKFGTLSRWWLCYEFFLGSLSSVWAWLKSLFFFQLKENALTTFLHRDVRTTRGSLALFSKRRRAWYINQM